MTRMTGEEIDAARSRIRTDPKRYGGERYELGVLSRDQRDELIRRQETLTDDEYAAALSDEDAVAYRQDRAMMRRAEREADELFKFRLKVAVVIIIIFVVLVASGALNSWLNSAPECYDRSCFGGGA